jgi:hypothetical protein
MTALRVASTSLRGAKRRSNPLFLGPLDGLLRFARNDDLLEIRIEQQTPVSSRPICAIAHQEPGPIITGFSDRPQVVEQRFS